MKINKMNRKSFLIVVTIMIMFMAMLLTACGSSKEVAPASEAETTEAENVKEEVTEPAESAEPEVVEEVVETEPTAEPTPEPVVYEGIDMESTLSGEEWIATFDGIITEPKLVVFNDETNKKVIVENGQEVDFESTDKLSIYVPKGEDSKVVKKDRNTFTLVEGRTLSRLSGRYKPGDTAITKNVVEYNGEEIELTATLNVK